MPKKSRKNKAGRDASYAWTITYKIGRLIASHFNLKEVLSLIGEAACVVTESSAAAIIVLNNENNRLSLCGSFGINKNIIQRGILKFEKIVVEQLLLRKKPFSISDIAKKPKFNHPSLLGRGGFSSALCAPVIFNERFLASFILYSAKPRVYAKDKTKVLLALAYQTAFAIQNSHLYTNIHMNYFNTIRALVLAMEARDPYTRGHSERVTDYALMIANTMGLPAHQVQMIRYCGLLHDVGKIGISDSILNKQGPLTKTEKDQISRHPVCGADVLSPLTFLRHGISLVKHHHERFDGMGYPDGLKGEKIPVTARILACADSYDAMTSDRPYRLTLTKESAADELKRNAGTQFDPQVAEVFLRNLENRCQENT